MPSGPGPQHRDLWAGINKAVGFHSHHESGGRKGRRERERERERERWRTVSTAFWHRKSRRKEDLSEEQGGLTYSVYVECVYVECVYGFAGSVCVCLESVRVSVQRVCVDTEVCICVCVCVCL